MQHTTITLPVRRPPAEMPDADTDVLIWEDGWPEAQLGAYTGHDDSGPNWANAQGERVHVVAWAELPVLGYVQETLSTKAGESIDLRAAWKVPA